MSFRERPLKGRPSLQGRFDTATNQFRRQPTKNTQQVNLTNEANNEVSTNSAGTASVRSNTSNNIMRQTAPLHSAGVVNKESSPTVTRRDSSSLLQDILPELRPFQREAYDFATGGSNKNGNHNKPRTPGKVLIADEMGLGKTLTSLAIMAHYRNEWPLLVLCPASLKNIWPSEIEKWFPSLPSDHIYVVSGFDDSDFYDNPNKRKKIEIVVASYSLLQARSAAAKVLERFKFKCIIADESHNLKQKNSQRTKLAMPLLTNSKRLLFLSGTPALAKPVELWSQLYCLDPQLFPAYTPYTKRYCNARRGRFGWDVNGLSNADELHEKLRQVMIRRLKNDVLHELPPKQRTIVPIQIVNKDKIKECKAAMEELSATRKSVSELLTSDPNQATELHLEERQLLMKAYQQSGVAKASPGVTDYLLEWLRGTSASSKILVFAHHKAVLDVIEVAVSKEFKGKGHIRIDGSVNSQERASRVRKFQTCGSIRVALLSITAAGVGLTLTAASTAIFAELHWTPGVLAQAEDRCHRIGQRNAVQVMYCVAQDPTVSIDHQMWNMLGRKVGTLGRVVDGKKDATLDAQLAEKQDTVNELQDFFSETAPQQAERPEKPVKGTIMSFFQIQQKATEALPESSPPARSDYASRTSKLISWACGVCTYENSQVRRTSGLQRCDMCGESYVETLCDDEGERVSPATPMNKRRNINKLHGKSKKLAQNGAGSLDSKENGTSPMKSTRSGSTVIVIDGDDDDDDKSACKKNSAAIAKRPTGSSSRQEPGVIVLDGAPSSYGVVTPRSSSKSDSKEVKSAILAFSVSRNSGRISVHDATSFRSYCVNFDIAQVVSSETADQLLDAKIRRAASSSRGPDFSVEFDGSAVSRVIDSVDSSDLTGSSRSEMVQELKKFVMEYLRLREIEKRTLKDSGKPFVARQLRKAVLGIMTDSVGDMQRRTTERYGGGAKEHARENIENGVASQQDMKILEGELCAWCGGSMPAESKLAGVQSTYCSRECTEHGRLKRGGRYASTQIRAQLFALEGGVCTKCGIDAGALFHRICTLHPAERLNALCNANWKLPKTPKALERLLQNPNEGMFWQADHIVAVSEGGGNCNLDNLRTLCVPCHADETEKLKSRLRLAEGDNAQSEPGRKRQADIRSMFRVVDNDPSSRPMGNRKRPKL